MSILFTGGGGISSEYIYRNSRVDVFFADCDIKKIHPIIPQDRREKISNSIDSLNPFEEKRDFFATSILSESTNLQFDSEGRISLTSKLLKHAKIKNSMVFVGQGKTFQIWEPTIFEKFKVNARKKANLNRASLKWEHQLNK